jgi:hypothetical protein
MWELFLHILVECRLSENFPTGTFSTVQYTALSFFKNLNKVEIFFAIKCLHIKE